MDQEELQTKLRRSDGGRDWYAFCLDWSAILQHRRACVNTLRDAALAMLDDPTMNRARMKRELTVVAQQIEHWGPARQSPNGERITGQLY